MTSLATGSAGQGLLEGNINPPTGEAGTGGIGTTGIYFNTVNKLLHVDVEWGSGNGYVDLSQNVFKLHLHGPTADSFGAGFGQTAPLMITLSQHGSFDGSATGGGVNGNFFLDPAQEAALLAGKTYINVHLSDTDTGMIRGLLESCSRTSKWTGTWCGWFVGADSTQAIAHQAAWFATELTEANGNSKRVS